MSVERVASVLYVVPDLFGPPGGIARYCRMVADALADNVHLVVVALHDTPSAPLPHDARFAYYACGGSKQRFVQTVLRLFWTQRPKIVLGGHVHLAPVVAWLCTLTNTPFIQFIYGIEVWERLSASRLWAVGQAKRVIAISNFTAKRAREINGFDLAKSLVLYNCLDPVLAATTNTVSEPTIPSILTVTRLSRADSYKGVDVALRAFVLIRQELPNARYHIVGDGDARDDLESLAESLGVRDAVRFHGRVSDEKLRDLYAQSSVFVMPSRFEGFGFVFLEAMAQGTPAIGGNEDATVEVIVDGLTGYTVNPTSVEAIADATLTLLKNPTLRAHMGAAAQEHARNVFDFTQFQAHLSAYLDPYLT